MNRAIIEPLIGQLDWMIGALSHATITSGSGGRTAREREACGLLRQARSKLAEDLARRPAVESVEERKQTGV